MPDGLWYERDEWFHGQVWHPEQRTTIAKDTRELTRVIKRSND